MTDSEQQVCSRIRAHESIGAAQIVEESPYKIGQLYRVTSVGAAPECPDLGHQFNDREWDITTTMELVEPTVEVVVRVPMLGFEMKSKGVIE